MEFSAAQIAEILNGKIKGDENQVVVGLSKIEEGQPNSLTFLANKKYEEYIYSTKASICIVNNTFEASQDLPETLTLILVEDAYACFAKLLEAYNQLRKKQPKIESPVFISETAKLGKDLYIGAFAYISDGAEIGDESVIYPNAFVGEGVKIGKNCTIHPGVAIYADCVIGDNCILHSGVKIGADGFGFVPDEKGVFSKVPQIGNVILEDNVEIGSNSTIDRATLGSTILRKGVKIDNLVHLAHNVEVGENSAMAAQAGVAGSTKIGRSVMIGGQAGISGHLHIADFTKIVAQSGIPSSVKRADTLMGSPGIHIEDFKKSYFGFRKLPFILNKIQEFDKKLKNIKVEE